MGIHKISDNDGIYTISVAPDIEFADPIKYYSHFITQFWFEIEKDLLMARFKNISIDIIENLLYKRNATKWEVEMQNWLNSGIHDNFNLLLASSSKKEQIKLLKGMSLTPDQLMAFIFTAWTDFGYSFSQYSVEYYHTGLDRADLPMMAEIIEGEVHKVGSTPLTDGQIRQTVQQRNVTIAKVFDKGGTWHCLFVTYGSLRGEETWKNGQPHFHYISDKFGLDRSLVVNQLKSKNYSFPTLPHIDLLNY